MHVSRREGMMISRNIKERKENNILYLFYKTTITCTTEDILSKEVKHKNVLILKTKMLTINFINFQQIKTQGLIVLQLNTM